MKPIARDELYDSMTQFLKTKGIELKDGAYPRGIKAGCSLLADAINLSQAGFARAKEQIDKNLERMRQVIHEQTAPRTPSKTGGSRRRKRPSAKRSAKR